MDIKKFKWIREPKNCVIDGNKISITTLPHTDLWQRTYYHFRNDNAPVFQMETEEKYFSFIVKTSFAESHHRFDQCGVVMYLDSDNWLKGSIEYENDEFQHLGSAVTNHGYSDWATTEIPATVKSMWYRLSRREDDYCIECSDDGKKWKQMRVCHLHEGSGKVSFGIYACSPEDSSFTAEFTDMAVTECAWKAHDGQQPDVEDDSVVKRITEMEAILDTALQKIDAEDRALEDLRAYQPEIEKLETYYSSQDWKDDFALDEAGKLPADLKCGVLSEDGIYNMLERYKELIGFMD